VERRASHKTSVGDKMAILPMLLREIDFSDGVFEKYKNWLWQEKHNGERVLVHIKDGKVSAMRNRNDNPVLHRFPELNSVSFPNVKSAILDCEIIVEENGKSKFYDGINQRRAVPTADRLKNFPVKVIVFDLIYFNGKMLSNLKYSDRFSMLTSMRCDSDCFEFVNNISNPKEYWYDRVIPENREGLVIKDPDALYYPGQRMDCQLKLKNYKRDKVIVSRIETNNKGVKLSGMTASGISGEIQWSSMGCENIKVGDEVMVEYLDVVNNKMVQPHKVKHSFIE